MKLEKFFPTGILTYDIDNTISNYIENLITPRLSGLKYEDAVLTDFFKEKIITLKEIQPLINEINRCQTYYSQNTNFAPSKGIKSFWVQDYKASSFHQRHNHGRTQYSVIYWVRAENNPGLLVIHNPNPFSSVWNGGTKGYKNLYTQTRINFTPKKGRIILFPGYLDHEVLKGGDNCVRTTIAFNLE